MYIRNLQINEFGVFQSTSFNQLAPGLTVVFGRNETGKTTLMHFLRGMLYGFTTEERSRYLVSRDCHQDHGFSGGQVELVANDELTYTIERTARSLADGSWKEQLAIHNGAPKADPQVSLDHLLGAIDEATFVRIYAIGLAELQELNLLGNTDAAQLIYRLTSGVDRVALIDILDEVSQARQQYLSPDGRSGRLPALQSQRDGFELRVAELQRRGGQWARLANRLSSTEDRIAEGQEQADELELERRTVEIARRNYREWQERQQVAKQLESLAAQVPTAFAVFSDDPIARLDDFGERIEDYRAEIDEIRQQRSRLKAEAEALEINQSLVQQAARVEAMNELAPWIANLQGQQQAIDADVARIEEHLSRSYGIEAGEAGSDAGTLEITSAVVAGLRGPARQLREVTQRARDMENSLQEAEQDLDVSTQVMESALVDAGCTDLDGELEKAASRAALLRRERTNSERLTHLRSSRDELVSRLADPSTAELLSPLAIVGVGSVFVGGFVSLTASLVFANWLGLVAGTRALLGLVGIAGILGSLVTKFLIQRNNISRLATQQRQLDLLSKQEAECVREGDEAEAELGAGEGSRSEQEADCDTRIGQLEQLVPLEAQRRAATQKVESATIRLEHARASLADGQQRWAAALEQAGLPSTLLPRHIRQYASEQKQLQQQHATLEQRRLDGSRCQMELEALGRRVEQVYQDAGLSPSNTDVSLMLRELTSLLSTQKLDLASYRRLAQKDRKLRKQLKRTGILIEELETRRTAMFTHTSCSTEFDFRSQASAHREFLQLRARLEELDRQIDSAIGGEVSLEAVESALADRNDKQLGEAVADVGDRIQAQQTRIGELHERAGAIRSEMRVLEEDTTLTTAQRELAEANHELATASQRWRVWETTRLVLGLVREEYENQRQPETLREASRWLQKMTAGRYTRVWTPLDEDSLLLDDESGQVWPLESLSSGTRETVYLALRLALIEGYRQRGVMLPVVLDDVLVNCDAQRTELAIHALCEFSGLGHQVFFFTCHEHVKECFDDLDVDSRELELRPAHPPRLRLPQATDDAATDDATADAVDGVEDDEVDEHTDDVEDDGDLPPFAEIDDNVFHDPAETDDQEDQVAGDETDEGGESDPETDDDELEAA
jgi:uncharacterized protein YhaN